MGHLSRKELKKRKAEIRIETVKQKSITSQKKRKRKAEIQVETAKQKEITRQKREAVIQPVKEEPKRTVLPTIKLDQPEKKRGILETLIKGPKGLEGAKKGTLPFGAAGVSFAKVGIKLGKAVTNPKAAQQTASLIQKTIAGIKAHPFSSSVIALGTLGSIIGSYPWAEWAQGEAREVMGFAVAQALREDASPETIQQLRDEQTALWDQNIWEALARLIPGANIAAGFLNKYKALRAQMVVNDKIMADRITQLETGETEDEKWERVREEEAEQDKAAIDYYNEQRKLQVQWEREADKAARNADAAFWRKERAKQDKMEAEDRQAIADFWIAYRKQTLKIANDNRPSNLNFGLL